MVDVALAAGVSQATVSLVLSGGTTARISADTRDRVQTVAADLGYTRRGLARGTGIGVIALLLDEVLTTPFATPFLDAAKDEAAALGWLVASFVTGGDVAQEAAILQTLAPLALKGVIYTRLITRTVHPPEALFALPTVLLNCHEPSRRLPSVTPGDVAGMQSATAALIRAGHRRIAHLPGEDWTEATRDRLRGYKQALAAHDIPFDPALVSAAAWTVGSGRAAMTSLLTHRPTAVTCFNDRVAIGACEAIRAHGLTIPGDISVIGYDNEDFVAHLTPPLSTVQLPHEEMVRLAVTLLAEGGAPLPYQRLKVDCPLVLRASVAANGV
jgi:LacI family transcriptional regulator